MRSGITKFAFVGTTLLLLMLFALPRAGSAQEQGLLYATADAGTKLVAANLEAKRVRAVGGGIGFTVSLALAFCPPEGTPYTITNAFDTTKAQLAQLNLGTGAATLVGSPLGQALDIMGMTCSPDGTLYAIGQDDPTKPDFNSLYAVDRETGLASRIGPTGVLDQGRPFSGFFMALAFAPDRTLYGANVSALYRVDPYTGEATKVVDLVGVESVMGLAIDGDGKFYLADWVPHSSIYTLDLDTGLATLILNKSTLVIRPGSAD